MSPRTDHALFDTDKIGKLLLKLTAPSLLGMAVITLYNVVDTIFIGHYVGPLGIAGLSIVAPIQFLAMGVGQMIGMGGSSLISRLNGSREVDKAEHVLGNAISVTFISSVLIMIIGLSNVDFWLDLIGASEEVMPYAKGYLQIILIGVFFQTLAMSLNFPIRAEGAARVSMTGMILGAVTNIILDAIFIISLDMGVEGAALATVIAQTLNVLFFSYYYISGASYFKIRRKNLKPDLKIIKSIIAIGFSSFGLLTANSIAMIFINLNLGVYGGDLAISTYGIIARIRMFAIMPGMVIGHGMQPIVGYNYGAKRYSRALKTIKIAIIASVSISSFVFFILFFMPEPLIRVFTDDAEIISLGSYAAKRTFFMLHILGFVFVAWTFFQSLGKVFQSVVSSVSRSALFLIPGVYILPRFFDLDGVWLAFPVADGLSFLLTLGFFIPLVRKLRKADRFMEERSANR